MRAACVVCGVMLAVACEAFARGVQGVLSDKQLGETQFDIRDYGAVGDGETLCTAAIQAAIQDAHTQGGVVVVAGGQYKTGSITLLSNVFLEVQGDGALIASTSPSDYPAPWHSLALIKSNNAQNIRIQGGGVIDGMAMPMFFGYYSREFDKLFPKTWEGINNCTGECRPKLVELISSSDIVVRDITLRNSPDWTSRFLNCSQVLVDNVTVTGDYRFPNNDGIDPDSSTNVTIINSYIDVGDDGVCLKSSLSLPLQNVLVQNCVIRSRSSAIKFGSSTVGDIRNITIRDIVVLDSNRGIGIQHRDQGIISDVLFKNITIDGTSRQPYHWWGAGEAIWITTCRRDNDTSVPIGKVQNIRFEDITARSEGGIVIISRSEFTIDNIVFENIKSTVTPWHPKRSDVSFLPPSHDFRPSFLPDTIDAPVDGFFFANTSVTVTQAQLTFGSPAQTWYGKCVNPTNAAYRGDHITCTMP